ncbi:hypothetical protein [Nonomuraea sp. NPDC052265]|uniref:hypothetical protein n=1 Tax=Nonomuraea sp. NPDC052265 TaxID=3364374 RepID=UPI0037C980A9
MMITVRTVRASRTRRFYRVVYMGTTRDLYADQLGNARVASMLRAATEWGLPITVTSTTRTDAVRACSWCRARPRAWEWQCEVRRELTTCDEAQCRAARRAADEGEIAPPSYLAGYARPPAAARHGAPTADLSPFRHARPSHHLTAAQARSQV